MKQLEKELEIARRACARQEALVRVTQRSLGFNTKPPVPAPANGKKRNRRPMVRALKAAQALREKAQQESDSGNPPAAELQPAAPGGAEEARP